MFAQASLSFSKNSVVSILPTYHAHGHANDQHVLYLGLGVAWGQV